MKRICAVAVVMALVGSLLAQGSFTIVRPADGSKVREKVRVLLPKNSIEQGSYVGVFLGGKFIEAVVPPVEGNYRVYTLDTKGRNIPDGELKLELVKYVSYQDQPKIVDRSSVTVTVGNQMNIKIPAGGVKLRYGFSPGKQLIYRVEEVISVSTLSGIDNSNGGRAASFPTAELSSRVLYAVDNTYSNGDALLRMEPLPDKGKDYSVLQILGEPEPRQVMDYQMHPVYMRITKTGIPQYGAVPPYFGFSSGGNSESSQVVYGSWPLPVLPEKAVSPGQSWQTRYQMPDIDKDRAFELNSVTNAFPARGEFVSAEWEMGHPTAKIRNSIAAGSRSFAGQQLEKAGRPFSDDKVQLDEVIWFALDTRQVIKRVRTITVDTKVKVQDNPGNAGAGGGSGGGPSIAGSSGGAGGGGGRGSGNSSGFNLPGRDRLQKGGPGTGGPRAGGFGNAPGGGQAPGTTRGGGGGGAARTQYIRQRYEQTFILEK